MSEHPGASDARELRTLYEAKAAAELADADSAARWAGPRWSGDVLSRVAAVKGVLGEAEQRGGKALSGADGDALGKALAALGEPEAFFATCSRHSSVGAEDARQRLAMQLTVVDPSVVIALDEDAAADVAAVLGMRSLPPGKARQAGGRTVLSLSGFEASLAEEDRKRAVWTQLKSLRPKTRNGGGGRGA